MESNEIRKKFLDFFGTRDHAIVPSSSLIPDDPSVLLTTAGMQQFKPYYTGKADPIKDFGSRNTASIQKSFRTSDIDEVGDESHLTFFEMLGNFSFGGYFKREAIQLAYDFFKEMHLPIGYVTVFEGDDAIPADTESEAVWQKLRVTDIRKKGRADNFWGPTGSEGPCGPTTEVYVNGVEIWNIVFNEYYCRRGDREKGAGDSLEPLAQNGVDTGMGLERLAMVLQKKKNIFETDLFQEPFRYFIHFGKEGRIIADHLRGSVFLIADGVNPSNKGAGYILRRLIRRVVVNCKIKSISVDSLTPRVQKVVDFYNFYPELLSNKDRITSVINEEIDRFDRSLEKGLREFFKKYPKLEVQEIRPGEGFKPHILKHVSIDDAFYFHQTYGLTIDTIKDLARRGGHFVDEDAFSTALIRHQEISRAGQERKFGGHGLLLDTGELKAANEAELKKATRLHTATHLLHAALRNVLGPDVRQDGSDITAERTRFDFTFSRKVTPEELAAIETFVNDAIRRDLPMVVREMPYAEAMKTGALSFFREKYPPTVKVYAAEDPKTGEVVSRELCGGPHVARTGEIGKFKVLKEESSSAGVRRIRAAVEP